MKKKILIVDDEKDDPVEQPLELIVACLGTDKYEYSIIEDVDRLVSVYQEVGPFDLVFADYYKKTSSGDTSGQEELATRVIRAFREIDRSAPIIVISKFTPGRAEVAAAVRLGADYYLDKGDFTQHPVQVRETVEEALKPNRDEAIVEDEYPLPVAYLYRDVVRNFTDPMLKMERVLELFEVWLRIICTLRIVSDSPERKLPPEFGSPTLGVWMKELLRSASGPPTTWVGPQVRNAVSSRHAKNAMNNLIETRNENAHGTLGSRNVVERKLAAAKRWIGELIKRSDFLRQSELIAIREASIGTDEIDYLIVRLKGANPAPVQDRLTVARDRELLKSGHVYLMRGEGIEFVDTFPFLQFGFGDRDQECLHVYQRLQDGRMHANDFIYGSKLRSPDGVRELLSRLKGRA